MANIIEADDEVVYGGLFEMSAADLDTLDGLEGSQGYSRISVKVEVGGDRISAATYSSPNVDRGRPGADYIGAMMAGARDCGIPQEHLTVHHQ